MVHDAKRLVGTVTRSNIQGYLANLTPQESLNVSLMDVIGREPVVAYPDEPLRFVVNRIAGTGLMRFPLCSAAHLPLALGRLKASVKIG